MTQTMRRPPVAGDEYQNNGGERVRVRDVPADGRPVVTETMTGHRRDVPAWMFDNFLLLATDARVVT